MHCDLCGKEITWGYLIEIEGACLIACADCAEMGTIIKKVREGDVSGRRRRPVKMRETEKSSDVVLVENFGEVIRHARESAGISREDLAKRLHVSEGYLHKIEEGELTPTEDLARKLEKVLGVKLFVRVEEDDEDLSEPVGEGTSTLTLGDIVKIRTVKK
jgi:putative transcription factor